MRKNAAALVALLFPFAVFAQDAAPAPSGPGPIVFAAVIGGLIFLAVTLHPLLKLADWLHAKAQAEQASKVKLTVELGLESALRSVDHFLEATQQDYASLADEKTRAAALEHIKAQAKVGALPALADAAKAMGSSWLEGAASSAVDAAAAKAAPSPS